jgi:glycosyltransferase involved in cell wall biosynthesis
VSVLTFGGDYWDGPRHNRHYFLEELGRHEPVLFVSPPHHIAHIIERMGKGTLHRSGVRRINQGLVNYTPSKLLFTNHRLPWLNARMRAIRLARVHALMRRHGVSDPVLLIWHPQYRDMIGHFGERLVVYYAYDQYTGYTGGDAKPSAEEIELMERADIVLALSRELAADKRRHLTNPDKVIHLANAVDYDRFATARAPETVVPADVASIPGPRIGYIGTINEKVNLPVLEALAERPEWHIVLIGRENYSVAEEKRRFLALTARPNVHWLGHRSFALVPAYIKGLDVLMMCYVINNWTFYGDPSKLHEYLASGKPTIGTGLPAIRDFAEVVAIPETPAEWVAAVETALREQDPALVARRIETARENSYQARIIRFRAIVQAALAGRPVDAGAGPQGGRS